MIPEILFVDRCPMCDGTATEVVMPADDGFALVRCEACSLVFSRARFAPAFLDTEHYGRDVPAPALDSFQHRRKRKAVRLYDRLSGGQLGSPGPGARALDLGCHAGVLLDELARLGYATEGVERAPALKAVAGVRHAIHDVDLEDPDATVPGAFAVVTMTHVLEHLVRPVTALEFVRRHLQPGGLAIIEVPNWGDVARPLWGRDYRPLELGDHVAFYEPGTLRDALQRAGLVVREVWSGVQGASLVMPSALTALDRLKRAVGRGGAGPSATVADGRVHGDAPPAPLRAAVLRGLDLLDPLLARLPGAATAKGANLVALATVPTA